MGLKKSNNLKKLFMNTVTDSCLWLWEWCALTPL